MTFKRIRLELARSHNHPQGSARHGYEFTVPLSADGTIDEAQFDAAKGIWSVLRFWEGEDDEHGTVVRAKRGFTFSYEPGDEDDEDAFRFAQRAFKSGEYLSVKGHDGHDHTFRVVSVRNAPIAQQ
jgi:hypothetical protein